MRNKVAVKMFLVIVLSTTYLIGFSQIGVFAYESIVLKHKRFAEGTIIGSVNVSGLTKEEAVNAMVRQVNQWQALQPLTIAYQEKTETIPSTFFTFQLEESVEQAVDGQPSQLFAVLDEKQFLSLLSDMVGEDLMSSFDTERLKNDIIHRVEMLPKEPQQIDLFNYLVNNQDIEQKVINEITMTNIKGAQAEVLLWISQQPTIKINAKSSFSLLKYFDKQASMLSSEALSLIASGIYQAILPTNFVIIERNISHELPKGIQLGYEAKVDKEKSDFIFYNPNSSLYTLEFTPVNNGFKVTLKGLPFLNKYVIKLDDVEYYNPKTVIQYSPMLQPGERRIIQEGKPGTLVKVKKEIYDQHNRLLKTELIAEDFYLPISKVEVHGLSIGLDLQNIQEGSTNQGKENDVSSGEEQGTDPTENEKSDPPEDIWGSPNEEIKGNEK